MFILFDLVLIHETEEVFSEHLSSFVKRYQQANPQSAAKFQKLTISVWNQNCIGREKLNFLSINQKSIFEIQPLIQALFDKNTKVQNSVQAYAGLSQQSKRDYIQILIKPIAKFANLEFVYHHFKQQYNDMIEFTIWKLIVIEQIILVCIWMQQHNLIVHNIDKLHFILEDLETKENIPAQKLKFIAFEEITDIQSPEELKQYYQKLGDLIHYMLFGVECKGNLINQRERICRMKPKNIYSTLYEPLLWMYAIGNQENLEKQEECLERLLGAVQFGLDSLRYEELTVEKKNNNTQIFVQQENATCEYSSQKLH